MAWPQTATPGPADARAGAISAVAQHGWYRRLKEDLSAASQARDLAWEALAQLGLEVGLVDDGVAIVGELVANAIMHGLPPVELQLLVGRHQVQILVLDHGQGQPVWGSARPGALSGRGLTVVSAYCDGNCGTAPAMFRSVPELRGNAVWAVLPRRPGGLEELEADALAHLLQRWLARRGLRNAAVRRNGRVALVSVATGCSIWCLPENIVVRTEDDRHVFGYSVFALCDLASAVSHVVRWSTATGPKARRDRSAARRTPACAPGPPPLPREPATGRELSALACVSG